MKTPISLVILMAVCAGFAVAQQPVLYPGGVLNAAGYALDKLPNAGIAQGSMFVVFGSGMGPASLQQAGGFPLQTTLAETSIKVTVGGTTVDAIMLYTSANQVAAILSSRTPTGTGNLTLKYRDRTSAPVPIRVVRTSFGTFAQNAAGSGPAVIQNYVSPTEVPLNMPIEAAHPGQVMVLWGTGLGPVSFDETVPPVVGNLDAEVEVWVGNKRANVQYKGRSASFPGIDQINFQIPQDAPPGCYVPVAVKAAGVVSNFTSIAIASSGKVCSDPNGLPASDLQRIAGGASLKLAWVQLLRMNGKFGLAPGETVEIKGDAAWGDFFRWDPNTLVGAVALNSWAGTALGSCTVATIAGEGIPLARRTRLNIGSTLNLRGPLGVKQLPRDKAGMYEKNALAASATPPIFEFEKPPSYLDPGTYSIDNGGGGADVAAFQASLTIPDQPQPLNWTNWDSIQTIDRAKDLTITWTGGDAAREYVVIGGAVFLPTIEDSEAAAIFFCTERADAGRFVIPSVVLSALPLSPDQPQASPFGVGRAPLLEGARFSGGGLDAGFFVYAELTGKNVTYR